MAEFSYIALVTTPETRTFYMAIAEGTFLLGILIGNTINGFVIDHLGLDTLAYATAGVSVLPAIVILLLVTDVQGSSCQTSWRDIINIKQFFGPFRTVYKKRIGFQRALLNWSFVMYSFPFVSLQIFQSASFLYFVKERGLTMSQYSLFTGLISAMKSFGGPLVVYLVKRLIRPDQFSFAIGCIISQIVAYTIMSIDAIPASMWIGAVLLLTQTSFFALVRALQTRICLKDEPGQLFAFDAIILCIMSGITAIVAKVVYTATLSFWPGLFLALCALLYICAMLVTIVVAYYHDTDSTMNIKLDREGPKT